MKIIDIKSMNDSDIISIDLFEACFRLQDLEKSDFNRYILLQNCIKRMIQNDDHALYISVEEYKKCFENDIKEEHGHINVKQRIKQKIGRKCNNL